MYRFKLTHLDGGDYNGNPFTPILPIAFAVNILVYYIVEDVAPGVAPPCGGGRFG